MEKNWMSFLQQETQLAEVIETNRLTGQFGLVLSEQDAKLILEEQRNTLREQKRVEFGSGMTVRIIEAFCDSDFISQDNYVELIIRLQEIFYLYKNEMMDEISDDELLHFMREQFDQTCFGDPDYLEGTCLNIFSQAIRAGYQGHKATQGYGEYAAFDEVARWDHELYLETLRELCWR